MPENNKYSVLSRPPLEFGSIENAKKSKPFSIFDVLRRRAPLVIALGLPLFIIFHLLLTVVVSPSYLVEGSILVKQSKGPSISGKERDLIEGDVGYFQRTLAVRLLDPSLLKTANASLSENEKPIYLQGLGASSRAADILAKHLKALEVERTYLIKVTLSGTSSIGLAPTLNAVLKTLIDVLKREQEDQFEYRILYLKSQKSSVLQQLTQEKEKIQGLAVRYNNKSFLRASYSNDLDYLSILQRLYLEAESQALVKEALFKKSEKDRDELSKTSMVPFAEEKVSDSFGVNQIEQWSYAQQQQLRASIDGLSTNNLDRANVESRIQAMKDYQKTYKENLNQFTVKNQTEKRAYELNNEVIRARNDYNTAETAAQKLHDQLLNAQEDSARISEGVFDANDSNFNLGQFRERLATINEKLDEEELQAKSPLPVVIDREATPPSAPSSGNFAKVTGFSFVASFGLLSVLFFLFEFLDDRIRSRAELGAAVGGKGAEPIPATIPEGEDPTFSELEVFSPGHPTALPLQEFALRLVLEHQRSGAKIFSFVGSHHRSGNTAIALNVGRAIFGHGFKVILAELPTSTPGLASIAKLSSHQNTYDSPWKNKLTDPLSGVELIPWVPGTSPNQVRSTLDSFLSNAIQVADFVLLDLVNVSTSDIAREASVKSDVVIITAAENIARFTDVRNIVEWVVIGGVPAVTTLLNFAKHNKTEVQISEYRGWVFQFLSKAHLALRHWAAHQMNTKMPRIKNSLFFKKIFAEKREKKPYTTPETKE